MILTALCAGEIQILDYSNSKLVALHSGLAKVQTGGFKIVHIIDLRSYDDLIGELENNIVQNITSHHPLIPYLKYTIHQIKSYLSRLKPNPKSKRSLDFLGSAWKWIAGSPDHQDFEIIQKKINNVLENDSNQVVINRLSLEKISKLTNTTNEIIKILKTEENLHDERILEWKYKLELLKEDIANIEFAIHLAKVNIVNSFILSSFEVETLNNIFSRDNIPLSSTDELLHFAEVKIAIEGYNILYILSVPTTDTGNCIRLLIKAIKRGNIVTRLDYEYVLDCKKKLYGLIKECKTYNGLSICSPETYEDISDSPCIPKLLTSQTSKCTTTNNQHVNSIEVIEDGILLLNQFSGQIDVDNSTLWLNGSYVIHHFNSTLQINNKIYSSNQITTTKSLPALIQPMKADVEEKTLSLEFINDINLNNSMSIRKLDSMNRISISLNLTLIAIFLIIGCFIISKVRNKCKNVNPENPNVINETNDGETPQIVHPGNSRPETLGNRRNKSIHSLPFF